MAPNRVFRLLLSAAVATAVAACARRPPLPDISGPLAEVIVAASFAGEEVGLLTGPLLLDSVSFGRLGIPTVGRPFGQPELSGQLRRPAELTDATTVLDCPHREPCHVRGNATWIEVWEAERTDAGVELVVSRVFNVQGLHLMTQSVTHRLTVTPAPGAVQWRLTRRDRLPA